MEVYKAIASIIGEMSQEGIGKNSQNKQQGFKFRGIDAVYNALAPKLAKYQLMILPRILSRDVTEKQTRNGGTLFYVVCDCEFDFVCAIDGSKHTVKTFGEAMDSGDKATNKAMSIALKYAAFQTFFIPTEATTQDPDGETHQVVSSQPQNNSAEVLKSFTAVIGACTTSQACVMAKDKFFKVPTNKMTAADNEKAKAVYQTHYNDLETQGL